MGIPGFPDNFHGPDGVRDFFRRWVGTHWGFEVEDLIDRGETVLVRIHQWGSGKGSGAAVEGRFWEVWVVRGLSE